MIILALALGLVTVSALDHCTLLCRWDGRAVCTGGSWTKSDGYCQGYLYKGPIGDQKYCYHTSETAELCPASGTGVKAREVEGLIPRFKTMAWSDSLLHLLITSPSGTHLRSVLLNVPSGTAHAAQVSSEALFASAPDGGLLLDLLRLHNVHTFPLSERILHASSSVSDVGETSFTLVDCGDLGTYRFESTHMDEELIASSDWSKRLCSMMLTLRVLLGRL
jgi:hypothetical protein